MDTVLATGFQRLSGNDFNSLEPVSVPIRNIHDSFEKLLT
jgi:hypothetical protein